MLYSVYCAVLYQHFKSSGFESVEAQERGLAALIDGVLTLSSGLMYKLMECLSKRHCGK